MVSVVLAMSNVFYAVDIYLKCHCSYHDNNGDLVEDYRLIRRVYLCNKNGLVVDLISTLPVDLIALMVPNANHPVVASIRLVKLVRLLRLVEKLLSCF